MSDDEQGQGPEIKYLGDVQKLSLQEDDILVIRVEQDLTIEAVKHIKQQVENVIGTSKRVLLFSGVQVDLGVLSPSEDTRRLNYLEQHLCRVAEVCDNSGKVKALAKTWAVVSEKGSLRETIDSIQAQAPNGFPREQGGN